MRSTDITLKRVPLCPTCPPPEQELFRHPGCHCFRTARCSPACAVLRSQPSLPAASQLCYVIIVFRPYPLYWHSFLSLLLNITSLLFLPPSPPLPRYHISSSASRGHLDSGSWAFQLKQLHLQGVFKFISCCPIHRKKKNREKKKIPDLHNQHSSRGEGGASGACRCRCARAGDVSAGAGAGGTISGNSHVFFGRLFLLTEGGEWKSPPKRFQSNVLAALLWVNNASAGSAKRWLIRTAARDGSAPPNLPASPSAYSRIFLFRICSSSWMLCPVISAQVSC